MQINFGNIYQGPGAMPWDIPEIAIATKNLNCHENRGIMIYVSVAENVQERAIVIQPFMYRIRQCCIDNSSKKASNWAQISNKVAKKYRSCTQYIPQTSKKWNCVLYIGADSVTMIQSALKKFHLWKFCPTELDPWATLVTRGRLKSVLWASLWVFLITPHYYYITTITTITTLLLRGTNQAVMHRKEMVVMME